LYRQELKFYQKEIRKKRESSRVCLFKFLMMTPPRFQNQPRDLTRINFLSMKRSHPLEESQRNSI
jgi:hypothetical protein